MKKFHEIGNRCFVVDDHVDDLFFFELYAFIILTSTLVWMCEDIQIIFCGFENWR